MPASLTSHFDRHRWRCLAAIVALALAASSAGAGASACFGTVGKGRLSGGVQLPPSGANFVAYSSMGAALGRTYVHPLVRDIAVDAYASLAQAAPRTLYVYGETGLAGGGAIKPHRTHQAGISIDFMVPVRNAAGASVALPASPSNLFGYGWEFDDAGRAGGLRIDFEAIADHLLALQQAAAGHKVAIERVIFDPRLTRLLFETPHGAALRKLPFLRQKPWIRHDEHYHVDFKLPCRPLAEFRE